VEGERVSAAVQNLYGHRNLMGQDWHSQWKMGGGGGVEVESISWLVGIVLTLVLVVGGVEVKSGPPTEHDITDQIST
jgi:hypothetical protein